MNPNDFTKPFPCPGCGRILPVSVAKTGMAPGSAYVHVRSPLSCWSLSVFSPPLISAINAASIWPCQNPRQPHCLSLSPCKRDDVRNAQVQLRGQHTENASSVCASNAALCERAAQLRSTNLSTSPSDNSRSANFPLCQLHHPHRQLLLPCFEALPQCSTSLSLCQRRCYLRCHRARYRYYRTSGILIPLYLFWPTRTDVDKRNNLQRNKKGSLCSRKSAFFKQESLPPLASQQLYPVLPQHLPLIIRHLRLLPQSLFKHLHRLQPLQITYALFHIVPQILRITWTRTGCAPLRIGQRKHQSVVSATPIRGSD